MFFSWENIKETWNDKVSNGDSVGEQALGVLQVVGKSAIAVPTEVAKFVVVSAFDDFTKGSGTKSATVTYNLMKNKEKELVAQLDNGDLSYEQREHIKSELEKMKERKEEFLKKRKEILDENIDRIRGYYENFKEEFDGFTGDKNSKEYKELEKKVSEAKSRLDSAEYELREIKNLS